MYKDFDKWNKLKKDIEQRKAPYFHQREIWWCYLGVNVGAESCGKNESFERPVLILKIFSRDNVWVIPLTSKYKNISNHISIENSFHSSFGMIEQMKIISPKRLSRKIGKINIENFIKVQKEIQGKIY